MKVEDLMVCDWILDGRVYAQVTSITCDGIIETTHNEFSNIELVEPIPLTPEILEKNGFKKFIAGQYILPMENKEIFVCITPMEGLPNANGKWLVVIKNGYTDVKIPITYIHELQHALKLCGIKKEIVI